MQTKLLQAFLAAGAPEDQAQAAAESVAEVAATPPNEMATKADVAGLRTEIANLRTEIAELEARLTWRMIAIVGTIVGIAVAIIKLT